MSKPKTESGPVVGLDLDGTLVSYGTEREPRLNPVALDMLRRRQIKTARILTNQAGIGFHLKAGDARFPSPALFVLRLVLALGGLHQIGIETVQVLVSLWHPGLLDDDALEQAAQMVADLAVVPQQLYGCALITSTLPGWRKPRPDMLLAAGLTSYWGDSKEDAEAAQAANVEYVAIQRF